MKLEGESGENFYCVTPAKKRGDEKNSKHQIRRKKGKSHVKIVRSSPNTRAEDVLTEPVKYSKAIIF